MLVLSIDQSTTCSGYCIFYFDEKFKNHKIVEYGRCKPKGSVDNRISETWDFFENAMNEYQFSLILLEDVYCSTNKNTFKKLSELLGGLEELANMKGVKVKVIQASEWRKLLNTTPKTKREELKQLSREYVLENFNLEVSHDISDSICLAHYFYLKKGEI